MSTSDDNWLAIIDRIAERAMERGERFASAIPAHIARKAVQQAAEAVAAARREGWAQAIEALRDRAAYEAWWAANATTKLEADNGSSRNVPWMLSPVEAKGAIAYLTDRAAALTEEGQ